uniref:Uncharacterized protein n=1 Tax=Utricularia reniformis TaxID=192314 RepID=A0A1Y0B0A1_9LAMI|nr:hypothetical protein AEK19_MT0611 [Utricularia reniformis]ART30866.1 hypothetical protein AEK19_MT0611 [Utricularia reniformis]
MASLTKMQIPSLFSFVVFCLLPVINKRVILSPANKTKKTSSQAAYQSSLRISGKPKVSSTVSSIKCV